MVYQVNWNMKSIQQANIDDAIRHMQEARRMNDRRSFESAYENLRDTLEATRDADMHTYNKYVHLLDERWN